ncbi:MULTISPECIES: shikimate kinase [Flavobacteriaceae]|uniref:shikimate kinase n=1 Tax=Flavobacteriaceae TaxID=49546 RepID=UPI00149167C4|nr:MULTISPECIES: shikimate kinase [Allomuricauda]MDC6367779.1 shikimate kinase [Muricauda sp. AC10]
MKVVLVGYMASGKSTVGKMLAKELDMPFIDLDDYIEEQEQKSISDIFSEKGEIFFRKLEHSTLSEVLESHETLVLSTGGGTPCYSGNMETILEKSDHSIYLQLSVPNLAERIEGEKDKRPLVSNLDAEELQEFIGKHLFERSQFYSKAKHIVPCNDKDLQNVVSEIKTLLI